MGSDVRRLGAFGSLFAVAHAPQLEPQADKATTPQNHLT
jgi:hypothetical protein